MRLTPDPVGCSNVAVKASPISCQTCNMGKQHSHPTTAVLHILTSDSDRWVLNRAIGCHLASTLQLLSQSFNSSVPCRRCSNPCLCRATCCPFFVDCISRVERPNGLSAGRDGQIPQGSMRDRLLRRRQSLTGDGTVPAIRLVCFCLTATSIHASSSLDLPRGVQCVELGRIWGSSWCSTSSTISKNE